MQELRDKAITTGRWRVLIGKDSQGRDLFRDNIEGDPLPPRGARYGLPRRAAKGAF